MASASRNDTPILIVGGGPVGLGLAIELDRLGVDCTLVEARDGTIKTPKMNFVNVRSMEFCRRWGITAPVREAGHPRDFKPCVRWGTSVTGYEIAALDFPPFHEEKTTQFSPEYDCLVSQLWFDPILLAHARTLPHVTLNHMTRLEGFRDTGERIEARVTDVTTGERRTITADWLVGCDGAASPVREQLGIKLSGLAVMQHNFHVFLQSQELLEIFERTMGHTRFLSLVGPNGVWGLITSINWRGLWRFSMQPAPEDESIVPELLRQAVGVDFEYELLDNSHWVSPKLVADSFRKGRAFIAGDAAHQLNPTGGFGMNTGLGDAMDIAWKLAAVVKGWGGPALLDSYDIERRPIAVRNVEEATNNFQRQKRFAPGPAIDQDTEEGARQREAFRQSLFELDIMRHHDTDGIALGYRYDPSPVICPDGTEPPDDVAKQYVPTARPGHRAPHIWLEEGRSILDLIGTGLTLLDFGAAKQDVAAMMDAADARGVPMTHEEVGHAGARALYERKLVLVRPDGHVAWRGDAAPDDPGAIIDTVRGAVEASAARRTA